MYHHRFLFRKTLPVFEITGLDFFKKVHLSVRIALATSSHNNLNNLNNLRNPRCRTRTREDDRPDASSSSAAVALLAARNNTANHIYCCSEELVHCVREMLSYCIKLKLESLNRNLFVKVLSLYKIDKVYYADICNHTYSRCYTQ